MLRIAHGSLLLLFCGRRQIVACGEGRVMVGSAVDAPVLGDNFQKLFQCGERTVVGAAGIVLQLHGNEVAVNILDRISTICRRRALHDRPEQILSRIAVEVCEPLARNRAGREYDRSFVVDAFAIHRQPNGAIDYVQLKFPSVQDGVPAGILKVKTIGKVDLTWPAGEVAIPKKAFTAYFGNVVRHQELDVDKLDDADVLLGIDRIFQIVRGEHQYAREIGPVTHCAAIDQGGFRWLHQGEACSLYQEETLRNKLNRPWIAAALYWAPWVLGLMGIGAALIKFSRK